MDLLWNKYPTCINVVKCPLVLTLFRNCRRSQDFSMGGVVISPYNVISEPRRPAHPICFWPRVPETIESVLNTKKI